MTHQNRLIRRPEVKGMTGLTDSALDRAIRSGAFPRPVPLLPDARCRAVGWSLAAVQQWVADRIAAAEAA